MGISEDKIFVVSNGVNANDFDPFVEESPALVEMLRPEGKIVLGFVGGFVTWHNFEFLLDCFRDLLTVCSDCGLVLLLVGDGPQRAEIERRVNSLGLKDHVFFTGYVSHKKINAMIQLMDICIIPHSNDYRSPIKLFEYMAMAKPVVAPRLEPIETVITDGVDGVS